MRVLRTFFGSLFMLFVVVGVVGLIAREILLMLGVSVVRSALSETRTLAAQQGRYIQECMKKNGDSTVNPVQAVQLRFTSNTEFVIEVLCAQTQLDSIVVGRRKLPWMVEKVPGTSGIIWGDARSGTAVGIWGRQRAIIVEDRTITYDSAKEVDLGSTPLTTCEGFGYACCSIDTAVGQGEQWEGATNCPRSCYQQCVSRPIVLSITTDPFYELETRSVTVAAGQSVSFTVLVDAGQATPAQVKVDYGDGTSETGTPSTELYTHAYSCAQASCTYPVKVTATDAAGVTSADTISSTVKVVVSP